MARHDSKNAILDAAEAIVIESGAARMTLDAVAKRTGVSKGGLIYNFPTKEALLKGMIDRMMRRIDEMREDIKAKFPGERSSELAIEMRLFQKGAQDKGIQSAALLAVNAANPDLTRTAREKMRERFNASLTPGPDFTRSAILYFANMGIHLADLLNFSILDKKQKKEIQEELLRLAGCDDPL